MNHSSHLSCFQSRHSNANMAVLINRKFRFKLIWPARIMSRSDQSSSQPSLNVTKSAARLACVFFLLAIPITPGYGSSLGMPWPLFFGTWGAMSAFAFVSLLGYVACRQRGESISAFYVICPLLLFLFLFYTLNEHEIISAILHWETPRKAK